MATKKKRVKSKSKIKKRTTPMATTRRKRRKRTSRTRSAISRPRSLSAAPRRRRRKRGFLSSGGSGLMASVKHNAMGALGGAAFTATRLIAMPLWMRLLLGAGGSMGLSMAGAPFIAAGLMGATTYHAGQTLLPSALLNDDGEDLEDADYVDADTLEDSGYTDEEGNQIVMDEDGIMYALNDNGDLEAIGDAYALNENSNMQSVSMVPLQDPYALASSY
jgi:hypothetical protein